MSKPVTQKQRFRLIGRMASRLRELSEHTAAMNDTDTLALGGTLVAVLIELGELSKRLDALEAVKR